MRDRTQVSLFHQHPLAIRRHKHCAKGVVAKFRRFLGDLIGRPQMFQDLLMIEGKTLQVRRRFPVTGFRLFHGMHPTRRQRDGGREKDRCGRCRSLEEITS